MTSSPESFETEGSDGGPLRGDLYHPTVRSQPVPPGPHADPGSLPGCATILCHGFRGYKDWGFLPLLARRLADNGIPTISFNFSGSGITDRNGTFGEPERFRSSTYGGELGDLARVVWWAEARLTPGTTGRLDLGLIGHSRGGAIALLHAAADANIRCVSTVASPASLGAWPDHYFEAWKRGESIPVSDFRTKSELSLGPEIFEDLERSRDRYDVARAVETLHAPLLILHGDRDSAVPLNEARTLASRANAASTEFHIVQGAGHSFQAGDTIRRTPPELLEMIEVAVAWMRRWLFAGD